MSQASKGRDPGTMSSLIDSVILALVIEKPSYGYELHERFERRFGHLLSTSQSGIYDVLRRLEGNRYLEEAGTGGSRGRPSIHYRATTGGVKACHAWLAKRLREDPQRLVLLSLLASTGLQQEAPMLELIERYEAECMDEARRIAMPMRGEDPVSDDTAQIVEDLIVEQRRRIVAAQLEWCAYARSEVRRHMAGGERKR